MCSVPAYRRQVVGFESTICHAYSIGTVNEMLCLVVVVLAAHSPFSLKGEIYYQSQLGLPDISRPIK